MSVGFTYYVEQKVDQKEIKREDKIEERCDVGDCQIIIRSEHKHYQTRSSEANRVTIHSQKGHTATHYSLLTTLRP